MPIINLHLMSFSYLIALKSVKSHSASLMEMYTGVGMKGNALCRRSLSLEFVENVGVSSLKLNTLDILNLLLH